MKRERGREGGMEREWKARVMREWERREEGRERGRKRR